MSLGLGNSQFMARHLGKSSQGTTTRGQPGTIRKRRDRADTDPLKVVEKSPELSLSPHSSYASSFTLDENYFSDICGIKKATSCGAIANDKRSDSFMDMLDFEHLGSVSGICRSNSTSSSYEYFLEENTPTYSGTSLAPKRCHHCKGNYYTCDLATEFCSGECKATYDICLGGNSFDEL